MSLIEHIKTWFRGKPKKKKPEIPPLTTLEVLESSKLFSSKTEIRKAMNNKAIKINGQIVNDLEEPIEHGDFLNFAFFCGGAELVREHGAVFLAVSRGKDFASKTLLKVEDGKLVAIA